MQSRLGPCLACLPLSASQHPFTLSSLPAIHPVGTDLEGPWRHGHHRRQCPDILLADNGSEIKAQVKTICELCQSWMPSHSTPATARGHRTPSHWRMLRSSSHLLSARAAGAGWGAAGLAAATAAARLACCVGGTASAVLAGMHAATTSNVRPVQSRSQQHLLSLRPLLCLSSSRSQCG